MAYPFPRRVPFSPPPGTKLGESDYSIPGQWCASDNMRDVSGKRQPIGGWSTLNSSPSITDYTVEMLEWYGKDGTRRLACANTGNFVVLYGSTLSSKEDVTPGVFSANTNNRWSLDLWGDHLIACWSGHGIYEWGLGIGSDLTLVTNAPTTCTLTGVSHTRQLFAFGTKEEVSGTFNPRCIRWSDVEDNTDWTTSPSNLAGEYILDGSGGSIKAVKKIGTQWAVWTENELFLGSYTSDPNNPWVFERQAINCGCGGPDAVTVADGMAYWVTPDARLMGWVPGAPPFELPGVPKYYLNGTATLAGAAFIFVWHNAKYNEIWFHVTTNSTFPTGYLAVNVDSLRSGDPQWFPGSLNRSCMYQGLNGNCYGFDWFNLKIYQHETGQHGVTSASLLSWSTEALVYVDEGQNRAYVNGFYPDFESQAGNVTLTVSTLDYPQGAETTAPNMPKTIAPGDDRTDFRASGKLFRFRFSGNDGTGGTNTFLRFGKNEIQYTPGGGR